MAKPSQPHGWKKVVCPRHLQAAREAALERAREEGLGELIDQRQDGLRMVHTHEHGRLRWLIPSVLITVPDM